MTTFSQHRTEIFNRNLEELAKQFTDSIKPPPDLTISEWSDRYRVLPKSSSSEPGPWRTERVPYMKEIMDKLSPQDPCQEVVFMKGSQISGTESAAINPLMYYVDHAPCPILYVQKTLDAVKKFSRQRLGPSIRAVPRVMEKIGDLGKVNRQWGQSNTRDASDTMLLKSFPGGILILGGANSAASLRSMPIQILFLDEVDSYEVNIDEEGDPVGLAVKRTTNFPRRKIVYISTPGVAETSRIEPLYLSGTQKRFHVPCPACGHMQIITWNKIVYTNRDPSTVKMKCEACTELIAERYKTEMFAAGDWVGLFPERKRESYHLPSLYSPIGWYSWEKAVEEFLEYKQPGKNNLFQTWVNNTLGETWSQKGRSLEYSIIEGRKEMYAADVPQGGLILTCGVDVQNTRLELEVVAWGEKQESWSVDYRYFLGDTERDQVWQDLENYLRTPFKHENGRPMYIACTAIDSGHNTRRVYQFCKTHFNERMFPVKGRAGWGHGLINRPKNPLPEGIYLFGAWVDELKDKVYSQLDIDEPGPGYCHFPKKESHDSNYFQMLVSEERRIRQVEGQRKLVWYLPPGRRNEALDCRAYSIAALNILNPNFDMIAATQKEQDSDKVVRNPGPSQEIRVGVLSRGVEL